VHYTFARELRHAMNKLVPVLMCLLVQNQEVNATTELEKVLKSLSSDPDALLLMGRLLPHVTSGTPSQQRLDLLKDGATHHPSNADIQVRSQDADFLQCC
jgi:hypothetical protein